LFDHRYKPMMYNKNQDDDTTNRTIDNDDHDESDGMNFLIYMHRNCVDFREEAVDRIYYKMLSEGGQALSQQQTPIIHSGGCRGKSGNATIELRRSQRKNTWSSNRDIFRKYRFCLVMENENLYGYITEKIINAFLGGCLPIYYGTEEIFYVFNAKAFIFYNISHPEPALERIWYLENHPKGREEYQRILREEPILANGNQTIIDYFSFSDDVGGGYLKRRIRDMLGLPNQN